MFGTTIDGDTSLGRIDDADVDVDFNDILENLKLGGMVHFEAVQKTGWGAVLGTALERRPGLCCRLSLVE
jgi:hypothetical protein